MKKSPSEAMEAARAAKENARKVLENDGIKATYGIVIRDTGVEVEISVLETDYRAACTALPFTLGSANVKIVKKPKPKPFKKQPKDP